MQNKLPTPKQVVSAIVENEGKFLLVKRMNPPSKGMYAFPGGKTEANETLEEAALRELHEETGLEGSSPIFYAKYDLSREGGTYNLSVFKVDVADCSCATAQDDAEEIGWFSLTDIKDLTMPPSMIDCFAKLSAK